MSLVFVGSPILNPLEVSSVTADTSASGADVLMVGMTLTPIAGKYFAWFSADINSANAGVAVTVSIYVGGTQVASSARKVVPFAGGTLTTGSARVGIAINQLVTVNGSQAVEVRWSSSTAGATVAARTLDLLRVG